ncbi:MAG: hypothetical protein UR27_C0006G0049 [Candidatus Peregrinibacteria bacterium GW2011_GWA2_33_10]|nr:MAG: hypothetical protein UR27_C0006G0049 [Candidatus Peregrinibacteria bacterium GW2011_GWA2_33_10]KKP39581.1 MAG: hypothetical protein UR30_C0009G0002 [Candidatus Peregrinibacteria bacterium GW2011_GWC2_33_13]OGJ49188.1 MAG: hypothetical protein A2229_02710 [Candidatus Peregrinibacteria bacterium RIFOXYA2_FULL_33_7]
MRKKNVNVWIMLVICFVILFLVWWKLTWTLPVVGKFCGLSTYGYCETEKDCFRGGCSGQVCQNKQDEGMGIICEWNNCYMNKLYNLGCQCINNQCQWAKK